MEYTGNELVSYNAAVGSLNCGGTDLQNTSTVSCGNYYNTWYQPYWGTWYPTYHTCERSKTEQAFKIVARLLENKIITKDLTIKEFIKLVNDIGELI